MALKKVANSDVSLGHGIGSVVTGGIFTVTSVPSTKVKAVGKGVHKGGINFTFAGGSGPPATPGTVVGSGTISPSATKVKASGELVNREDDSGSIGMTGTKVNPAPPPPLLPVNLGSQPVKVSSAGQSKVKAQ